VPTVARYVRQLQRLIERYGEDVSLSEALQRESNPKPGHPRIGFKIAHETFRLVELAINAGYRPTAACRLVSDVYLHGDLPVDFVRNRYRRGRERFESLFLKHRAAILESYAAECPDWVEYLRAHPGPGFKQTARVKTTRI
jgi:hypothetical protein